MSHPKPAPQVDLRFERRGAGPTFLARQLVGYPFHVGRVLRHADAPPGAASVLLQSCSGGLFEHDQVAVQLKVCSGAGARVGSAAATVVHSMTSGSAVSRVRLEAEPDAWLEYLPAMSILFPQARLVSEIDVVLHPGALIILADAFLAHDPQSKTQLFDEIDTCVTVRDENQRLLTRDRVSVTGLLWNSACSGVSAAYLAQESFLVLTRSRDAGDLTVLLRAALADLPGVYAGVGTLPNRCGALVRILVSNGESLRQARLRSTQAMRAAFALGPLGAVSAIAPQPENFGFEAVSS